MAPTSTIETDRLVLRPFVTGDAPAMQAMLSERDVVHTLGRGEHPYPKDGAAKFIASLPERVKRGSVPLAVERREDGALLGGFFLHVDSEHDQARLGYWIGKPYWHEGYATEAGRAVIDHAFQALSLQRVWAECFPINPSSERVLQKLGMRKEGVLRSHFVRMGERRDCIVYGILREEWRKPEAQWKLDPATRLETKRLVLRRLTMADVPDIMRLAGDKRIAATTLRVPHPYEEKDAVEWVMMHDELIRERRALILGIEERESGALAGTCGLEFGSVIPFAELGYWVGVPFWGRGYATEASEALADHAFEVLDVPRLVTEHMTSNAASGRVLEKLGFVREGVLRKHHRKWGEVHDIAYCGLLKEEWEARRAR